MKTYQIKDIKGFMAHILMRDTFDGFLLGEARISGKALLTLNGTPAEGFYAPQEEQTQAYVPYGEVREVCFSMVKGSRTPEILQMLLLLPKRQMEALVEEADGALAPEDVESLSMLIRYKEGSLVVTAGSALRVFTMDRALDWAWEAYVEAFLTRYGIEWDILV